MGSLSKHIHVSCGTFAVRLVWEKNVDLASIFSLEIHDNELVKSIAREFVSVQAKLEVEPPRCTKSEVIGAFSAFYHIMEPGADSTRYLRSLIEKTFEALNLGPIPEAVNMKSVGAKKNPPPSPSRF